MTTAEMIEDVLDLIAGGTAILLPAFLLAAPAFVLLVLPVLVVGAVLALIGAVLAAPVVLALRLRKLLAWRTGIS
jgi:hypothetical protein